MKIIHREWVFWEPNLKWKPRRVEGDVYTIISQSLLELYIMGEKLEREI